MACELAGGGFCHLNGEVPRGGLLLGCIDSGSRVLVVIAPCVVDCSVVSRGLAPMRLGPVKRTAVGRPISRCSRGEE